MVACIVMASLPPSRTSGSRTGRDFLAYVTDRYFRIVSTAIKRYDPNHLFLGSRFHGGELNWPEVFKAAGPYVDVLAVNYYRTWTPSQQQLAIWSKCSGRPILITEWYVKGEDSGMPNYSGAGWIVRSPTRPGGSFYQNFALGLLESKVCVGWHWFKYSDNDHIRGGYRSVQPGCEQGNCHLPIRTLPCIIGCHEDVERPGCIQ